MASQDDVNRIMGGFGAAAQGLSPWIKRQQEEEERNTPLSGYEKWLGQVLSGQMSPEEAAVHAKLEAQGQSAAPAPGGMGGAPTQPQQPQQAQGPGLGMPPIGPAPQGPDPRFDLQDYGPMPTQGPAQPRMGLDAQPPRPPQAPAQTPGQGLGAPQTRGDMQSLMGAAPFLQRSDSNQMRLDIERLKEQGRNTRHGNSIDFRAGEGTANREVQQDRTNVQAQQFEQQMQFKRAELSQRWQEALLRAQSALRNASMRSGSNEKIAAARVQATREASRLRAIAQEVQSIAYTAKDPFLMGLAQQQLEEIKRMDADIDRTVVPLMQGKGGSSGFKESKSSAQSAPAVGVDDLESLFQTSRGK